MVNANICETMVSSVYNTPKNMLLKRGKNEK